MCTYTCIIWVREGESTAAAAALGFAAFFARPAHPSPSRPNQQINPKNFDYYETIIILMLRSRHLHCAHSHTHVYSRAAIRSHTADAQLEESEGYML